MKTRFDSYEILHDAIKDTYTLTRYNRNGTSFSTFLTAERFHRLTSYFAFWGYCSTGTTYTAYTLSPTSMGRSW